MTGRRAAQRAEIDARIMESARAQLRTNGAAQLSLRSVARDLSMVSSAVYRYVPSRDALLTRLISEAYDSMGDAVESAIAVVETGADLDRWVAAAAAARSWAVERPHEYLLLYGTPVLGYEAPDATVQPGTRVIRALAAIVSDAAAGDRLDPDGVNDTALAGQELQAELAELATDAGIHADGTSVLALIVGWTQLFGLIGFEITNQTRGFVSDGESLLLACAAHTGRTIGLR